MDVHTLETLRDQYPTSSWALWSPGFPTDGCVEENPKQLFDFILEQRDSLRPSVVLLSLNPSTHMPSDYQNFHSTDSQHRNDQFRDYIVGADLEGAYMTDLVERVNPDSNAVKVREEDIQNFLDQLELLDQERYYVICFLNDVFTALRDAFDADERDYPHNIKIFSTVWDGTKLDCFKVYFHANWGVNQDKTPDEQLKYLNDHIIEADTSDLSRWLD